VPVTISVLGVEARGFLADNGGMLIAALVIALMVPGLFFLFWIVIQGLRGKADERKNDQA
jgi:hypothetical protein